MFLIFDKDLAFHLCRLIAFLSNLNWLLILNSDVRVYALQWNTFTDRSKAVHLLWIIYVISALFCYAFVRVCLRMPWGHLLGKGWSLDSRLWCLIVELSLSHWYPGSGVVLDWINSWSLPSFLLYKNMPVIEHNVYHKTDSYPDSYCWHARI